MNRTSGHAAAFLQALGTDLDLNPEYVARQKTLISAGKACNDEICRMPLDLASDIAGRIYRFQKNSGAAAASGLCASQNAATDNA